MLEVKNLYATINGKEILKGINFVTKTGEVYVIVGPNSSGRGTLSVVPVGNPMYEVTQDEMTFNGKDPLVMSSEDRAHERLFLSSRYPVEIPGVSMTNFIRATINEKREYQGQEPMDADDFIKLMKGKRKVVELDSKPPNRSVNKGFSSGEKRYSETFQMAILEPTLSILDETDPGLDVDTLHIITEGVNKLKRPNVNTIVTIYHDRLLGLIKPDVVHVLSNGRIVKTGGSELAREIKDKGHDQIKAEVE